MQKPDINKLTLAVCWLTGVVHSLDLATRFDGLDNKVKLDKTNTLTSVPSILSFWTCSCCELREMRMRGLSLVRAGARLTDWIPPQVLKSQLTHSDVGLGNATEERHTAQGKKSKTDRGAESAQRVEPTPSPLLSHPCPFPEPYPSNLPYPSISRPRSYMLRPLVLRTPHSSASVSTLPWAQNLA